LRSPSDKIIELGVIFLILFPPLAFGSVYVWAFSIMEIVVFSTLTVLIVGKGLIQGRKISFPLLFPVIAFLTLVVFQMVPLPTSAIKLISPKTYELYCQNLDGYPREMMEDRGKRQPVEGSEPIAQRLDVGGETKKTGVFFEDWRTLSICPHATRTELLKIFSYLGAFLLIINYVDSKRKFLRISAAIALGGIVVALLGIAQKITAAPKIYWFWKPFFKEDASFFGPFVNPNHFAGYIEMVIPLSIGLLIFQWKSLVRDQVRGIREFLINIGDEKGCKLVLFFFLIILMVGALFLSYSRAGVISFSGSMMCLLAMVVRRERARQNIFIVVVLLISTFSFLVWMGIRPLLEEFTTIRDISRDYDIQYRFQNWKDSLRLVRDFPVFGVGLEAFPSLFPKYKTATLQYYYLYLENDYLQLLCEMGIVGFGIFLWFAVSFARVIGLGDSKYGGGKVSSIQYISLYGCLTGLIAIVIHSFWDFNMRIPSNALLLSMLMGLAICGIRFSRERHSEYPPGTGSRFEAS
jgi:O-antigen ligase